VSQLLCVRGSDPSQIICAGNAHLLRAAAASVRFCTNRVVTPSSSNAAWEVVLRLGIDHRIEQGAGQLLAHRRVIGIRGGRARSSSSNASRLGRSSSAWVRRRSPLPPKRKIDSRPVGRVEDGCSGLSRSALPCFPSPLVKPDVRISRIRLSDRLHRKVHWLILGGRRYYAAMLFQPPRRNRLTKRSQRCCGGPSGGHGGGAQSTWSTPYEQQG
jgi:hypothetical protein